MPASICDANPLAPAWADPGEQAATFKSGGKSVADITNQAREHTHLLLISEASKGLADVVSGHEKNARDVLSIIRQRRSGKNTD